MKEEPIRKELEIIAYGQQGLLAIAQKTELSGGPGFKWFTGLRLFGDYVFWVHDDQWKKGIRVAVYISEGNGDPFCIFEQGIIAEEVYRSCLFWIEKPGLEEIKLADRLLVSEESPDATTRYRILVKLREPQNSQEKNT